ncbi:MAG: thioredoxin family protein [Verrucomicrobiota bacterium]|nr:thioredoxin family protein [Verrucomicrobiota bacterium]
MNKAFMLTLLAGGMACASVAGAQEKPVRWRVGTMPSSVNPGASYSLKVHAEIDAPWHLYSVTQPRPPIATRIVAGPARLVRSRIARQPAPLKKYDPNFEITSELFAGRVTFELPVAIAASVKPGRHKAFVAVLYQACTEVVCLPPAQDTFAVALNVKALPAGAALAAPLAGETDDSETGVSGSLETLEAGSAPTGDGRTNPLPGAGTVNGLPVGIGSVAAANLAAGGQGFWPFIALAALMGGLALLTPCVFPMIPITVSYITKRNEGSPEKRSRRESVRDAMVYGVGIIMAFSALGLLLAIVFGATGINRFAANPWVNLLVAALFVGFALDLLGVYSFRLPWQMLTKLHGQTGRGGNSGLLIMGLVFAVTTFTCTVPFVGTLLVAAAAGNWAWPLLGMLVFSTVFALPFFVLALVPEYMRSLPRSGSWMGALKVTLGLVELGAAFKFLSNVDLVWQLGILHRSVVIAIWVAIAAAISLYLFGAMGTPSNGTAVAKRAIGPGRLAVGGVFLAFTLFLASGLFGRRLGEVEAFLPPQIYPGDEVSPLTARRDPGTEELAWFASYDEGLATARSTNRPIFVDFTGFTCTNCRWMEANVFPRDDVQELFSSYVLIRLYTDGQGEKYARNREIQLRRFGTVAMPLYAILSPSGESVATLAGLTRNSEKFASFLRDPLKKNQTTVSASPGSGAYFLSQP